MLYSKEILYFKDIIFLGLRSKDMQERAAARLWSHSIEMLVLTAFVGQLNCDDVASRQGLSLT